MQQKQRLDTLAPFMMFLAGFCVIGSGCDGNLSEQLINQDPPGIGGQSGRITNMIESSGAVLSQVNASDAMSWIYIQLASGKEVMPHDPQSSTDWDLALQRYQIKVNGGISGTGGVEVALVTGTPFSTLTAAPQSGYVTDQPDSADEDQVPDYAFLQRIPWYSYNPTTHLLTPNEQVYVIRSVTGIYYKLQMIGYYDQAGSSGYPTFRWQRVNTP